MLLANLLDAMREISSVAEFNLQGQTDSANWVCTIRVSQVIILQTGPGELDFILEHAAKRLKVMAENMQKAIDKGPAPE